MRWKTKKLNGSQIEVLFELSPEEFDKFREKVIFDLKKDFQTEGFRKGKVPEKLVLKEVGEEKISKEAAELAIEESYLKYIAKEKIEPVTNPQIKILKFVPRDFFRFKATFSILPEIKLPDYKKIASRVKKRRVFVDEKDVENVIKQIQFSRAKLALKEGPAIKGDFVEIEYSCPEIRNGKKFQDAFILGKGFFIPGFEEKLIGMEDGQEKIFSLRFPENHLQKDLAGKDLEFRVKTKAVKKVELSEINDDFARGLGNFEDLNTLKKSIREGLKPEKERFESQRIRGEILNKIREGVKISLPDTLIKKEKDYLLEDFKKSIPKELSFEGFLKRTKKTEEEFSESLLEAAEKRIKNSLIIREILKREGIEVSESEIEERISEMLKGNSTNGVDLNSLRSYIKGAIIEEKVFQFLENVQKPNNSKNS